MDLAQSIGLTAVTERNADGNPLLDDGEEVLQSFADVRLVLASDSDQGVGKVVVTDGRIFWLSAADAALGFTVDFPTISMHAVAVATDPDAGDAPCMYIQLDQGDNDEQPFDEDDEDASVPPLPELRLVPADAAALDAMFKAFCEGAERNPDAGAAEEGQGSLFFDRGEMLAGAFDPSLGAAEDDDDFEALVGGDPDRFGDAAEEEDADGDAFEEFEGGRSNGVAKS